MVSKPTPSTKPATEKTSVWRHLTNAPTYIQRQWHTLALVALYIFFRPTIESKLGALFLDFNKNEDAFYCCIALGIIAVIYAILLGAKGYVLNNRIWLYFFAVLVGWYRYRFLPIENYQIAEIPIEKSIYYIDFLLVICFCILIVKIVSWLRCLRKYLNKCWHKCLSLFCKREQANPSASIEGYIVDYPASPEDADLLGRSSEVLDLAKKIFHTDTSKAAFTLGLTAPWGAGKTSFMLAMQKHLRENYRKKIILIEFNPWMYRKAPNLTQIFFEELSRALAPYSSALASGFMQYVDYILSKENNTWIQLGARLLPQGFKAKSTSEQYKFLEKEIGKLSKKIIIFIDDVDRLDSEELTELFCLVRNISPFPNMSYILAYDKEYVATQLQKKFDAHTYHYMEKIVQVEYPLAKITPEQLEKAITDIFNSMGDEYIALKEYLDSSHLQLVHHLPSLRSIKHIHNCLLSLPNELQEKVRLFDWFIIELLRIQYPRLFEFLKENYVRAFDCDASGRVTMKVEQAANQTSPSRSLMFDHQIYGEVICFRSYLSEHQLELQIENVDLALELMMRLWDESRDLGSQQANNWDCLERYLYRTMKDPAAVKYHKYINPHLYQHLSIDKIKVYIKQVCSSKERDWLASFFYRFLEEDPKGLKEIVYMLYVSFCALSVDECFYGINPRGGSCVIVSECDETEVEIIKRRIEEWIQTVEPKDSELRIMEILNHQGIRKGVIRYLSWEINCNVDRVIPFDRSKLEDIREHLFLEYLEEKQATPVDCYLLWPYCQTYIRFEADGSYNWNPKPIICHPQMDTAMERVIKENMNDLIPYFIGQQAYDTEQGVTRLKKFRLLYPKLILRLDKEAEDSEVDSFLDFIEGLDGDASLIIKEFKEFAKTWREVEGLVPFEFKYMTPKEVV